MIRISTLVNDERRITVYDAMRPAGQLLANRRRRRLAAFSRSFARPRPPAIFMYDAIAGVETRSIERTENPALNG